MKHCLRRNQRASAVFAEEVYSKTRDEYQQGKVTSKNKKIEQRCGVPFEAQGIATTLTHRK
jgi:hypothetical protein